MVSEKRETMSRSKSTERTKKKSKKRSRSRSKSNHKSEKHSRNRSGSTSSKHLYKNKRTSRSRSRDKTRSKHKSTNRSQTRSRSHSRHKNRSKSRNYSKSKKSPRRSKSKKVSRSRSRSRKRQRNRSKERSRSRSRGSIKSRSHSRSKSKISRGRSRSRKSRSPRKNLSSKRQSPVSGKWRPIGASGSKRRSLSKEKKAEPSEDPKFTIDKARLRQIALKNAFKNATTGVGPALKIKPDEIVAFKAGGKSLQELTEYCKKISEINVDNLEEILENTNKLIDEEEMPFIPARTNKDMRSGPPKEILTLQEKLIQTAQMSSLFPVSSGTQHKETPSDGSITNITSTVSSADSTSAAENPSIPLSQINASTNSTIPISVKNAMIDNNSNDELPRASFLNKDEVIKMSQWVPGKDIPGQFTGSTGVQVLSQQELSGNFQTWAKKDTLSGAAPYSGGIGKLLLQKMGWKDGEGLGKNSEGMKVPIAVDVKTDRKGLVTPEEDPDRIKKMVLEKAMMQQAMLRQAMLIKQQQQQQIMRMQQIILKQQATNNSGHSVGSRPLLQMPLLPNNNLPLLRMPPAHIKQPLLPMPNSLINPGFLDPNSKHPVSYLTEVCSKRKWDPPEFILLEELGPSHHKMYKFKIILNGVEYVSPNSSIQKKTAKMEAATLCLKKLGLIS